MSDTKQYQPVDLVALCVHGRSVALSRLADKAQPLMFKLQGVRDSVRDAFGHVPQVTDIRLTHLEKAVDHLVHEAHGVVLECEGCCETCDRGAISLPQKGDDP